MSPVAPSSNHAGRALLVAVGGVVALLAVLGLATLALSGRNSPDLRLGDQTFQAGDAKAVAARIRRNGPELYSDVSGRRDRDLILQHLGTDPKKGWYAFLAAPADKARDCTWVWVPDEELFRARCDRSLTAPADGKGLTRFPVTVTDGRLEVDLNADARTTTTTSKPRTSTSERPDS